MAPTPGRLVRVPDELWDAAMRRAEAEGTTLSAEINAFLRRFIKRPARQQRPSD